MFSQRRYLPHALSSSATAVLLMILATLLTSFAMVVNKFMVLSHHSPAAIVFWRSVFSLLPLGFLVHRQGGVNSLKSKQLGVLAIRGLVGFASIMTFCAALHYLPVFTAESLFRLSPILVFTCAILFLKEKFNRSSLLALIIAMGGVCLILTPTADAISWGGLIAVASAMFYAIEVILTRTTSKTHTATTLFFYYTAICLIGSLIVLGIQGYTWPSPSEYVWFIAIAFLNLGINLAFTEALRRSPASRLAPLEYLTLAWVMLLQIHIWGELPSLQVILGAMVILLSGFWILKHNLGINTSQS